MSPRFVTDRDVAFFKGINKELIDTVIENTVLLWKLSLADSPTNVYGESTKKMYFPGVQIACLIERNETTPTAEAQTVDVRQSVEFRFLRQSLIDRNVYPEAGDVVEFDTSYYEIENVNEVQLIEGQPYYNYAIVASAHLSRRTSILLEEIIR